MNTELLQPVAVLALWSLIIWIWMYATRIPAMRKAKIDVRNLIGGTGADIRSAVPAQVQWKADNYNHLMEQPTIFYAVSLVLVLGGAGGGLNATLGWIYVGFRIVHSLVQAITNRVMIRFALHFIGTLPLIMLAVHAVMTAFEHKGS